MIRSKLVTTVIPSWLITYTLTDFQFRLFTLLEYFRFTNEKNLTSNLIGEYLGKHRDTVRRELNHFNDIFPDNFLKIHFVKNGLNTNHKIVIDWQYINNRTNILIEPQNEIPIQDKHTLTHFLKNSHYFSNNQLDEILSIKKVDFENLIKGLLYVDTRKDVKEPLRYLRSCFKHGVFKYDKEKFDLELLDTKVKDFGKRVRKLSRVDSTLLFGITLQNMELLKHLKDEHLNFYGVKTKDQFLISRATYQTKNSNVKNQLDKFKIPYTIYLR